MQPSLTRQALAEFLGTLILILFGLGVVAMVALQKNGEYTNITIAWGLAVTLGVFVAGPVSGAHLNPAVTLAEAVFNQLGWLRAAVFMAAQLAGAFCGAALVFLNYRPVFQKVDPQLLTSASVFCTFPAFPDQPIYGWIDQILGTALLLFCLGAIGEKREPAIPGALSPLLPGLVVIAIGMAFGGMHGYAINPARDFGPRLFTVLAGFANNGLTDGSGVFLVPLIAPFVGGLLGAGLWRYTLHNKA
jgi:glycerol uptake facilitator protein